jgi:hypothetical protein
VNTIRVIVAVVLALLTMGANAGQNCNDRQDLTKKIDNLKDISLHAWSCRIEGDKYTVSLELKSPRKTHFAGKFSATGPAFTLSIDNTTDLDGDGVVDVGVANGTGPAGDGMSYWLFKIDRKELIYVGDAPHLTKFEGDPPALFALIPGSGDVQATMINYIVESSKLREYRAIQFIPVSEDSYKLQELVRDKISVDWKFGNSLLVPALDAQNCMASARCPTFDKVAR